VKEDILYCEEDLSPKEREFLTMVMELAGYDLTDKGVAESMFKELLRAYKTFLRKNMVYGNSFGEVGAKGCFIEIHAKFARLKTLLWKSEEAQITKVKEDAIQNAVDLMVYALCMIHCLKEGNVYGK
jgi:hypothetical protein